MRVIRSRHRRVCSFSMGLLWDWIVNDTLVIGVKSIQIGILYSPKLKALITAPLES